MSGVVTMVSLLLGCVGLDLLIELPLKGLHHDWEEQ